MMVMIVKDSLTSRWHHWWCEDRLGIEWIQARRAVANQKRIHDMDGVRCHEFENERVFPEKDYKTRQD